MKVAIFLFLLPFNVFSQTITTVAGTGILGYYGDGLPATVAKLHIPGKVVVDNDGNLFIADSYNNRVRRVDAVTGIISTIAGTGAAGYNSDGIAATSAKLNDPVGLAFDTSGNLFIADVVNHRIRKVDKITGIITTVAGNGFGAGGLGGYSGDGIIATSAELNVPGYIAIDANNNIYISDGRNYRIRRVDVTTNIITTVAGNGISGYSGDGGPATSAKIMGPQGLSFRKKDNRYLFVADSLFGVRKIDFFTGIITTVSGNGVYGYSGDGSPATNANIEAPFDVVFDFLGNYYIAEFNGRVRKVDTFGIISTFAGNMTFGYSGDGIPATSAQLNETTGLDVDVCGNLYIADASNERIRKVTIATPILTKPAISLSGIVSAKAGTTVTVTATVAKTGSSCIIHWMNHGIEFTTTTVPSVTYTKGAGTDTITARVVSTATYGCYDSTTSTGHVVTVEPLGITPLTPKGELSVYPNPAGDVLHIDGVQSSAQYRLVNMVGVVMQTGELSGGQNSISTKGLASGVYVLEVSSFDKLTMTTANRTMTGGGRTISRIIKQ